MVAGHSEPLGDYSRIAARDVWRAIDELCERLEKFALDPVSRARDCERRQEWIDVIGPSMLEAWRETLEGHARAHPRATAAAVRARERLDALHRDWAAGVPLEDARRRLVEVDAELCALDLWWQRAGLANVREMIAAARARGEVNGFRFRPAHLPGLRQMEARDRRGVAATRRRLFTRRALLGVTVVRRRLVRARPRGCRGHARRRGSRAPPGGGDCDGEGPHEVGRRRRGWAP
jgi:hypothetical protein